MDIEKKIKHFPETPGVYIMKSSRGKVLYVGKAISLRSRLRSYVAKNASVKTSVLMQDVADVDYISCQSPEQALILEAALIKEKKPKYNISLRDNKSYPYIEVTKETFPRIFVSRPKTKTASMLFGPYPKVGPLKAALKMIRKIFPYCSCRRRPKTPCLYYHLSLCPAPCARKVNARQYCENINNICRILKGERRRLIRQLQRQMQQLSRLRRFEEAAHVRDKLQAIESLYSGKPAEHEILSLKETLGLEKMPLLIEAIDISSLGAHDAVGSLVVFKDGVADKSSYRRFRIKEVSGIDDYAMIAEVVNRRYRRLLREKRQLPDLIIVDGGKGHVQKAQQVLEAQAAKVMVIGIAKEHEEIWFPHKTQPLRIARDRPCLHLIQRIRDEAHRFAHAYQLKRRSMNMRNKKRQ